MNNGEFNILLIGNLSLYLVILMGYGLLYYLFLRKEIDSFFDPFLFLVIGSYFSQTVLLLLYLTNNVCLSSFVYGCLSEVFFFIGLGVFKRIRVGIRATARSRDNFLQIRVLQYVSFFVFFVLQLYVYYRKGIPLFQEERLALFRNTSGFGIFDRIIDAASYIVVFSSFYLFFKKAKKKQLIFVAIVLLSTLLSGSKASFLMVAFIAYICLVYEKRRMYTNKLVIFLVLVVPIFINILHQKVSFNTAILYTIFRFIKFGDIFYIALPHDIYKSVELSGNGVKMLFSDLFGMLRISPWSSFGTPIGFQLFNFVHPANKLMIGPNVRHNIFGLIYFGKFGGILFSFCLGSFVSFFKKRFDISADKSFLTKLVTGFILLKVYSLNTDPIYGLSRLNNIFFVITIALLSKAISLTMKKNA